MKNYLLFAASLLTLVSCSSDDILSSGQGTDTANENSAINFASETGKITRAGSIKGGTAAKILGEKFYVLGTKGTLPQGNPTDTKVFDNYQVVWKDNSAGTSTSNTNDWEYVGQDFVGLNKETHAEGSKQSIKYWDYSVPQYDFIAYSVGDGNALVTTEAEMADKKVYGSSIATPKADDYKSYQLKAKSIDDLSKCYFTDVETVVNDNYGKPVTFTFKNVTAKVRVAFYETIPGYTVSELKFYTPTDENKSADISKTKATLYTTGEDKLQTNSTIDVLYPEVGANKKGEQAYNKAFITVSGNELSTATQLELGNINYNNNVLATSAQNASMAGESANSYYTSVLPVSEAKPLTIRMNYTLTSEDGSNEKIHVYGAKAVIPAAYTAWQPNHAYTYIFKISDNTNGSTATDTEKEGLFPITFDAVVADVTENDFSQETITTVSSPSVTTYAWNETDKKIVKAYEGKVDQYPAGSDIYFSVTENANTSATVKNDLNSKGHLYKLSKEVTEAEVINALQVRASTSEDKNTITGRNNLTLTAQTSLTYPTNIPTEFANKDITVKQNEVALAKGMQIGTYAYVYDQEIKDASKATTLITAIKGDGTTKANENEYFKDYACTQTVEKDTVLSDGVIYYKKYTNNNNIYGVKVVTIK